MPEYEIAGQRVRRSTRTCPARSALASMRRRPEERRILKETYWADYVAASEWPALLAEDGFSPSARSRLKKKAAGWTIALGRIGVLNPELFAEIVERATGAYEEQTETKYPAANVAVALVSLQTFRDSLEAEPGTALEVSARLFKREEADDAS